MAQSCASLDMVKAKAIIALGLMLFIGASLIAPVLVRAEAVGRPIITSPIDGEVITDQYRFWVYVEIRDARTERIEVSIFNPDGQRVGTPQTAFTTGATIGTRIFFSFHVPNNIYSIRASAFPVAFIEGWNSEGERVVITMNDPANVLGGVFPHGWLTIGEPMSGTIHQNNRVFIELQGSASVDYVFTLTLVNSAGVPVRLYKTHRFGAELIGIYGLILDNLPPDNYTIMAALRDYATLQPLVRQTHDNIMVRGDLTITQPVEGGVDVLPPVPQPPECSLLSPLCWRDWLSYLFVPSGRPIANTIRGVDLENRVPFSFIYQIRDIFNRASVETQGATPELAITTPFGEVAVFNYEVLAGLAGQDMLTLFRTILQAGIWLGFAAFIVIRIRGVI